MKKLPAVFRSGGFDFKLLARDGDIALFRKTKPRLRFESLEVVIIQRHETFKIEGKLIPAGEHLPSSEQWGSKGWTFSDKTSAERKAEELSHNSLIAYPRTAFGSGGVGKSTAISAQQTAKSHRRSLGGWQKQLPRTF